MNKDKCFCNGAGKYIDYNCGIDFYTSCPHCQGTGEKECECKKASIVCQKYGRGAEVPEPKVERGYDDVHWNFID